MAEEGQQAVAAKKGLLSGWLPKILIIVGVLLVLSVAVFGVKLTIPDILMAVLKIILGIGLVVLIIRGITSFIQSTKEAPSKRFLDKLIRLAKISRPPNVERLDARGEDMRITFPLGKVRGMLFIPYLAADTKTDAQGNYLWEEKKDRSGEVIQGEDEKKIWVHAKKTMTESEGEWFFVLARGFWIFAQEYYVRARTDFVSELGTVTYLKTVNLVPFGNIHYPNQQWQHDIVRINTQHQAEILLEASSEFWDYLESLAQRGVSANPIIQQAQALSTDSMGGK